MEPKKYHIFLVTVLLVWAVFFPAYVHYYNLAEADCLHNPHWENPFQEGLLAGLIKKWEFLGWNVCPLMSDQDNYCFELVTYFSFPNFCPTGQILILRC